MVTPSFVDLGPKLRVLPKGSGNGSKLPNSGRRPKNGPPSGQTATYRKSEGIQSYLRIWGCYDPIESGPSETKKGGFYGCCVRKLDFFTLHPYNPPFWVSDGPDSMGS